MEGLAFDSAVLEQRSLLRAQKVESCRQQCLEDGWEAEICGIGAALAHMGQELLQEERVPARSCRDAREPDLLQRLPGEGDEQVSTLLG
jgi:hypothetical protein